MTKAKDQALTRPKKKRPGHRAPPGYDPAGYERPAVACDVAMMTFKGGGLSVLLIERKHDPYAGYWAVPGGFVEIAESLPAAAGREVLEETGVSGLSLIELGAFGDPDRDPRGRVISVAYLALLRANQIRPRAGDDARRVKWFPASRLPELAFDHDRILAAARERLRELAVLTPRLFELLPPAFPPRQFLQLCREVMGRRYDDEKIFFEAMRRAPGFVPAGAGGCRDRLYRFDAEKFQMGDFMFLLLSE